MKIHIDKLLLDKENPRFKSSHSDKTEEEIFKYLLDYEVLDKLINGIRKSGYFTIGERPIVVKDESSDNYIVLEGNRRICALKALHGYYSNKYSFDQQFKQETETIEVDVVESREEVQSYLAARHIQGIQLWKPESRRNFYYKHYEEGKSLEYIEKITQQKLSEIKSFIKQSLFLNFFKEQSNFQKIDNPSFVYDRLLRYFIHLKLVHEIMVSEEKEINPIKINKNVLNIDEFREFCNHIAEGIYGDDKYINARSANKVEDFISLMHSDICKEKNPRLNELFLKVTNKLHIDNFIPIQLKTYAVKGDVPNVKEIIDYELISNSAIVEIYYDNILIEENAFINGEVGNYLIKINEEIYKFKIVDLLKPEIKVIEAPFKNVRLETTEDISKLISIYDVYGKPISLMHSDVKLISNSEHLNITENNNLIVYRAGTYSFDVKYAFENNPDYMVKENIVVICNPNKGTALTNYSRYFDFKYLDVAQITTSMVTGKLINELEYNYDKKNLNIFASALRSLLELSLEDFIKIARNKAPNSDWSKNSRSDVEKEFKKLTPEKLEKIAKKYYSKTNKLSGRNYLLLKNYLCTNITTTSDGHSLNSVINALHLGAHKSLNVLHEVNLKQIQPYLIAWLELIYILIEIDFES